MNVGITSASRVLVGLLRIQLAKAFLSRVEYMAFPHERLTSKTKREKRKGIQIRGTQL